MLLFCDGVVNFIHIFFLSSHPLHGHCFIRFRILHVVVFTLCPAVAADLSECVALLSDMIAGYLNAILFICCVCGCIVTILSLSLPLCLERACHW